MMKKERREIYCRLQKTNKNIFFNGKGKGHKHLQLLRVRISLNYDVQICRK
jgi:hypothetical protein